MSKQIEFKECVLINTLYHEPALIASVIPKVSGEDFSQPPAREIYELFVMGAEAGQSNTSIQSSIYSSDNLQSFMRGNAGAGIDRAGYENLAKEIKQASKTRKLKDVCTKISFDATCDLEQALNMLQKAFLDCSESEKGKSHTLTQILKNGAAERLISKPVEEHGIMSDFYELNKIWTAQRNKFVILAARASIGKTAFAMTLASHYRQQGKRGLFFSLEMDGDELTERLSSIETGIPLDRIGKLNTAAEIAMMGDFINSSKNSDLIIFEQFAPTITEIRIEAIKRNAEKPIDFIIIDYLQLIKAPKAGNREQAVAAISAACKGLAKELGVPVIVLAQLNREAEEGSPKLSHLRESGSLEQDADTVILLDRDRALQAKNDPSEPIPSKLIIAKNRGGRIGFVEVEFVPERAIFQNAEGKAWN